MTRPPLPLNAWLRFDLVDRVLRRLDGVTSVLELGSGAGAVGARLCARYEYVAVEPDEHAYEIARRRLDGRGRIVRGDVTALEPGTSFDLVCAFEVLEHIEDDVATLRSWRERVRDGGWLVLSVPAHARRFGAHDRLVGHYRRYDPGQLADVVSVAGFERPVVYAYGFPFGYLLEGARNVIGRLATPRGRTMAEQTASSGRWLQPPARAGWLTAAVSAPFRLLQRPFARTSWGTGLVVVAQRPSGRTR